MGIHNLTGTTLGQYELRELLGAGGMGAVYRGYQANLKRYVAVKVISGELARQPGYLERFNREAKVLARLSHPNIVAVRAKRTRNETRISIISSRLRRLRFHISLNM